MIQPTILEKLEKLPESLQIKVLYYIDLLIEEQKQIFNEENSPKKYRTAGTMRGKFIMSDDFDQPLDDLKDYM